MPGTNLSTTYRGQHTQVPRLIWEIRNDQPVPPGMQVVRVCHNSICVNPDHLVVRATVGQALEEAKRKFSEKDITILHEHALGLRPFAISSKHGYGIAYVNGVVKRRWSYSPGATAP